MKLTSICMTFLIAAVGVGATTTHAAEQTPEDVMAAYFRDLGRYGFAAGGRYMAESELARFRTMMMPIFQEGFRSGKSPEILLAFTKGDSLQQVEEYSPREFFERTANWLLVLMPTMDTVMRQSQFTTIGHVLEGDTAHVVYRISSNISGRKATRVTVGSLKKQGDGWKMLLSGDFENMAASLQSQMGRQ